MSRILRSIALLVVLAPPIAAQEPAKTETRHVKVVYTQLPPYAYETEAGPTGYTIELLRGVAKQQGWTLAFRKAVNPNEAIVALRNGEADLHPGLAYSDDRARIVDYSAPLGPWNVSAIVDPTRHDIFRVDQTTGLNFGYVKGSIARTAIRAGPFDAVEVESIDALLGKFVSGELDGAIFIDEAFEGLSWRAGFHDRIRILTPTLRKFERHIVMSKESGLAPIMDEALFEFIDTEEHLELRKAWFGSPAYWTMQRIALAIGLAVLASLVVFVAYRRQMKNASRVHEREKLRIVTDIAENLPFGVKLLSSNDDVVFDKDLEGSATLRLYDAGERPTHEDQVRELMTLGAFDLDGRDPEAFVQELLGSSSDPQNLFEFQMTDGRQIRSRRISLSNGATLIVREDVTNDRRLQRELETQGQRLSAILDVSMNAIISFDQTKQVTAINRTGVELLGLGGREPPFPWPEGLAFIDAVEMTPIDAASTPLAKALAGEELGREVVALRRPEGGVIYVTASSATVANVTDDETETVLILDDVTEQVLNRQQIDRANRLEALGDLSGGVAHDFNNLLAAIQYSIRLSETAGTEAERRRYRKIASDAVKRGAKLTQRLMSFARQQPSFSTHGDVGDVMREVSTMAGPLLGDGVSLRTRVEAPEASIFCDLAQLETALLNLLLNASDAIEKTGRGGYIDLIARSVLASGEGDDAREPSDVSQDRANGDAGPPSERDRRVKRYVEFVVKDDGVGMSEEVALRAADPFFTTKDNAKGAGLGLSAVYGFANQSDGALSISSKIGEGATVTLSLPETEVEGAPRRVERGPRRSAPGDSEVVLIVDDEKDLVSMMSEVVRSLGFTVLTALNGRQALEMLESADQIDVLLTDISMPGGLNGFQLAKEARRLRPGLPIIYTTGYASTTTSEPGTISAPILHKPSQPSELETTLRAVLDERAD